MRTNGVIGPLVISAGTTRELITAFGLHLGGKIIDALLENDLEGIWGQVSLQVNLVDDKMIKLIGMQMEFKKGV